MFRAAGVDGLGFRVGVFGWCEGAPRQKKSRLEPYKSALPVVSIVVPFWGYLLGSLL